MAFNGKSGSIVIEGLKKSDEDKNPGEIKVLCFDLTYLKKRNQFLLCCIGIFILYLLYGYLQELIFTLDGFKPFGWYLTLVQFAYYISFSFIERQVYNKSQKRCIPIKIYCLLALLTLGTMGLSNSSLGYLNYPTQKHGPLEFLAASCMCIGLTLFTLADSKVSPNFDVLGIFMISVALLCDAAIGNVQEKAMRDNNAPSSEVVLYSYGLGFIYLVVIMAVSGNLIEGIKFCAMYPKETYGYAFLFSLSGYLGIQFVLTLVKICGAPLAATVTTARKAVTIAISFVLFAKPFTLQYLWSGLIVCLGIYLQVYSKGNKLTFDELKDKFNKYIPATKSKNLLFEV